MTTRRAFIGVIGGAAAWPLAARAQQPERMRRIGLLMPAGANDLEFQARVRVFREALQQLGWTEGVNVRIDARWATSNADIVKEATELARLGEDVIVAYGTSTVVPLVQATRTVPIVFPIMVDPVGAGVVESLARPGGNATGFMVFEYGMAGKWLDLLKQVAPQVNRIAVIRDPATTAAIGQFGALQTAAPTFGVEVILINASDAGEVERGVTAFARSAKGALLVLGGPVAERNRDLIVSLAARHNLPAMYYDRSFPARGGLLAYGPDFFDQFRRAAGYVDRILKGEKPADLPVQAPTKYELVVNLKTARTLGLEIPPTLLARADEVIE